MNRRYKIKDIATMAGVSAGTVDRVIHCRGEVSTQSKCKVNAVLSQINYEPNLHISAIGLKREVSIVAVLPTNERGGYWDQIEKSIRKAIYEYSHIKIKIKFLYFNQFDMVSCRNAYAQSLELKCDAMLIGVTFLDETMLLTSNLDKRGTPYVFVDNNVAGTKPLAFFGADSDAVGYIEARLILSVTELNRDVALFRTLRRGDESSSCAIARQSGFMRYIAEFCPDRNIIHGEYHQGTEEEINRELDLFFAENRNVGGAVIFSSRTYAIADYFKARDINNIALVGCGAIERNYAHLRDGYISYLLSEGPDKQGYHGVKAILEWLLFGKRGPQVNYTPVDILIKENIDYYLNDIT